MTPRGALAGGEARGRSGAAPYNKLLEQT